MKPEKKHGRGWADEEPPAYICMLCDYQFYWENEEKGPACPKCGATDEADIVPAASMEEEEYQSTPH